MIKNVQWKERHTTDVKEEIARCYLRLATKEIDEKPDRLNKARYGIFLSKVIPI